MAPFLPLGLTLPLSFQLPPQAPRQQSPRRLLPKLNHHEHSTVISPYSTLSHAPVSPTDVDVPFTYDFDNVGSGSLSDLCGFLGASPLDLLYLSTGADGERGVYVSRQVKAGDVILRVPLKSCLRSDEPPSWFSTSTEGETGSSEANPGQWASCLSASLLDLRLRNSKSDLGEGLSLWLSMLPDSGFLRASLPVHWTDETLANAKCTALELAADTSYFARAEAVRDIVTRLRAKQKMNDIVSNWKLQSKAHDALDLIQTRSCRVERVDGAQWGPPLHILAPIFDFINHGSSRVCSGDGCANSSFGLEGGGILDTSEAALVVRATRDIEPNDEVLLDYGDSARPAWKCLNHYGFVPNYYIEASDKGEEDDNVAEIFMRGVRYEVGPSTVPVEMAEAVAATLMTEVQVGMDALVECDDFANGSVTGRSDNPLTIDVARAIAKRLSEVAYQLLLEPEIPLGDKDNEDDIMPEPVIAAKLAASLRWSQHQVLLACADGLRDYAAAAE